jgi:hypothetical protein
LANTHWSSMPVDKRPPLRLPSWSLYIQRWSVSTSKVSILVRSIQIWLVSYKLSIHIGIHVSASVKDQRT